MLLCRHVSSLTIVWKLNGTEHPRCSCKRPIDTDTCESIQQKCTLKLFCPLMRKQWTCLVCSIPVFKESSSWYLARVLYTHWINTKPQVDAPTPAGVSTALTDIHTGHSQNHLGNCSILPRDIHSGESIAVLCPTVVCCQEKFTLV